MALGQERSSCGDDPDRHAFVFGSLIARGSHRVEEDPVGLVEPFQWVDAPRALPTGLVHESGRIRYGLRLVLIRWPQEGPKGVKA